MTQGDAQSILNPTAGQVVDVADMPAAPLNADLQTEPTEATEMQSSGGSRSSQGVKGATEVLGTSDAPIRGEQFIGEGGVLESNNAVTEQARALVVENPNMFVVTGLANKLGLERLNSEPDLFNAITLACGSTNIKWGKNNPAQKSVTFRQTDGRGTRAAVIQRDGTLTMMGNNTPYAQWYHKIKELGGYGLIFRFDQSLDATNPYMQCDVFKSSALPAVSNQAVLDWEEEG